MKTQLEELKQVIEKCSGVTDISEKNRQEQMVVLRSLYSYLAYNYITPNYSFIGRTIGRNHGTIMNLLNKINDYKKLGGYYQSVETKVKLYYQENLSKSIGDPIELTENEVISRLVSEKRELIQKLKSYTKRLSPFLELPDEKQDDFIKTRLVPYLKMNGINS